MASNRNNNNTGNQQQKNEEKSKGSWFVPAVLGAAVGAGLAYILNQSQSQNCPEQRHSNSSRGDTFVATPRGCCSICRDDYEATITLGCGHILHRDCYEEMKRFNRGVILCPLCRKRAE